MDWTRQIAITQDMLDRIVALLLSLADLAEYAAGAPDARRRLALAIIRSGQAVTRDAFCVAHAAHGQIASSDDGPEDALALAASLRALALFVAATIARIGRTSPGGTRPRHADETPDPRQRGPHVTDAASRPVQWHDTS